MSDEAIRMTTDNLPEIDDAAAADIAAMTEAVSQAIGDEHAAEPLAVTIMTDIEREAVAAAEAKAEATGEQTEPEELSATIDAAQVSVRDALSAMADGIGTIELPEFTYGRLTDEKDADGKIIRTPKTIPAGTYELCTIKTLTGERRRHALRILAEMGIYTLRFGSDTVDKLENILSFATSHKQPELLGHLYRRTDGMVLDVLDRVALGDQIDERFNIENIVGVVNRFFSSSGSGSPDAFAGYLTRLSGQAKSWIGSLMKGR